MARKEVTRFKKYHIDEPLPGKCEIEECLLAWHRRYEEWIVVEFDHDKKRFLWEAREGWEDVTEDVEYWMVGPGDPRE